MRWWAQENADRITLAAIGVGSVVMGIVFHEDQVFSTSVTLVGIGVLVLAVLLRHIDLFTKGAKGVDARLVQLEDGLEAIEETIRAGQSATRIASDAPSDEPTLIPDPPRV